MSAQQASRSRLAIPSVILAVFVLLSGMWVISYKDLDASEAHTRVEDFLPALWPEQWRDEHEDAQERADGRTTHWRLQPEETVLAFVREVMRWDQIASLERCPGDTQGACGPGGGTRFAISHKSDEAPLLVELDQLGRTGERGVWSVVSVQGPRVFLDIAPGETLHVGDPLVANTTLPDGDHEYLGGGTSYQVVPGGCGSGGGRSGDVENGRVEFPLGLVRVDCISEGNFTGSHIYTGERIQTAAVGFVYVAFQSGPGSIGFAMDHSMPPDLKRDLVGTEPIRDLAAVPVLFSPEPR